MHGNMNVKLAAADRLFKFRRTDY